MVMVVGDGGAGDPAGSALFPGKVGTTWGEISNPYAKLAQAGPIKAPLTLQGLVQGAQHEVTTLLTPLAQLGPTPSQVGGGVVSGLGQSAGAVAAGATGGSGDNPLDRTRGLVTLGIVALLGLGAIEALK